MSIRDPIAVRIYRRPSNLSDEARARFPAVGTRLVVGRNIYELLGKSFPNLLRLRAISDELEEGR